MKKTTSLLFLLIVSHMCMPAESPFIGQVGAFSPNLPGSPCGFSSEDSPLDFSLKTPKAQELVSVDFNARQKAKDQKIARDAALRLAKQREAERRDG